ncbi:hypothetical protein [Sorangium sp. So ce341]|uniref:hypothetical protein n=1 Tax=Sorangium sp. So ce341 TaxID=3133302 RepID=UPI003F5F3057
MKSRWMHVAMAMAALTAGCAAGEAGADEIDMDEAEAVEVEETSQALCGSLNPRNCGWGGGGNWGHGGPSWGGGGNWGYGVPSWGGPNFPKPCFGNSWRPYNSYDPFGYGTFRPGFSYGGCNNRW